MGIETPLNSSPTFDFIDYFKGHRRASGWFSDRFGNVKRHFSGDFFGTIKDNGELELDEKLIYNDGLVEARQWVVAVSAGGAFHAESDSLIGPAVGEILGDTLNMKYVMKVQIDAETEWKLSMHDTMILQPDGSLHNFVHVKKFGVRIGTVSTQYFRPENMAANASTNNTKVSAPFSTEASVKASNM